MRRQRDSKKVFVPAVDDNKTAHGDENGHGRIDLLYTQI